MTRSFLAAVVLAAAAVPSPALAGGLALGARIGFGTPGGDIDANGKLADFADWALPLQLDVGYRGERFTVGAYFRIGPGKLDPNVQQGCDAIGASCAVSDYGIGAEAEVRLTSGKAGPWLGGFVGYEEARYDFALGPVEASIKPSGWELGAQGGIDFAWGILTLGPYASVSVGQFTKSTLESGDTTQTQSISDRGTHTWLALGVRAGVSF